MDPKKHPLRKHQHGRSGRFEKDDQEPLWAELFSPERLEQHARSLAAEQPVGDKPFSPEGAGMAGKVKGRKLPNWKMENGWAGETPAGPQNSREPVEELTLIPYGCTNIRITEFPMLQAR